MANELKLDQTTAAMVALAEAGIPTDVQELLVRGDPDRGIAPGAITKALNTRPSALVEGLETVSTQFRMTDTPKRPWGNGPIPENLKGYAVSRELVTRSQAGAIIAAERADKKIWMEKAAIEAERVTKLEADNAALNARVKELVHLLDQHLGTPCEQIAHSEEVKALETKLAAAKKALEQLRSDCQEPIDMYERNGPEFTSPHGNEYESTSYVMAKCAELVASIDEASAVLEAK